ncbi:MAG: xanthine dehydrogenase family protein molybdopterin-binding subunit [Actinobacteria bacterium]|nr:xanthine dehydrogenase family protein molybdopterin-binding subunit [Actinomycetota bacterium]
MRGEGEFVADIKLPRMRDVAFVRSPIAHGRIRGIDPPPGAPVGSIWTAADLRGLTSPIVAVSGRPGFRPSEYPILSGDKVRFVGETVALAIADDRAAAEDLAEQVFVDLEELPAVVDWRTALADGAPRLHEDWPDNRFIAYEVDLGDIESARRDAHVTITREYSMGRMSGVPLECRGVVAYHDTRADQLVVYSSTQWPHVLRTKLAELLGIEERRLRVIAPDVGGGFGIKNNVYPEEVALGALALRLGHPVRWIEDRWEHLVGSAQARDHHYVITAHAAADGTLLGLEAAITVNAGAYSVWPWTAAMEAGMASGIIPGPYQLRNYRFSATTVATNTTPLGPYRGVARPGACFAIERTIDEVAHELGLEPRDVRLRNVVPPDRFPYESVTGMIYDSGDYPGMVTAAAAAIDHDRVREEQRSAAVTTRRIGLGYASYTEQTAHGVEEWDKRGLPVVFGFEAARVALDPSGSLTVDVGIQSHGQGLETTLAQVANEVLGIPPQQVTVRHGDTAVSPYGMGTFASRSMVMAGGATYRACEQLASKIATIGAALLGCDPTDVRFADGQVTGPDGAVTLAEIADAAYLHVGRIPPEIEPGLEVTYRYRPEVGTGTFSSSTHVAKVEVDTETGDIRILDYLVVEDCGKVVNPMIVDGQVHGGVAQGIGQALYEESRYDPEGQPRCTTFMDYLLPGSTEVPDIRIEHRETLSPFTVLGMKGMGEGGAIAPPAAIANAVTDALRPLGVSIGWTPITPASVWLAIQDAAEASETVEGRG